MTRSTGNGVISTASFNEMSEITEFLFLSAAHVIKPDALKKREINFVVNATVEEPNLYFKQGEYLKIRVTDHPLTKLDVYFDLVADRIYNHKQKGGKTLVHCVAGVSRSASLVLVYLIKYENMTLRDAYRHVKAIRPIVRPNWGFWRQLINYEQKLRGTASVRMVESKWGPDEPVPDVYSTEIKENVTTTGSAQQDNQQPHIVRANMYTVPKYYARRSKSEQSMTPGSPRSSNNTSYTSQSTIAKSRPPSAELYRNNDITSSTVTVNRSPLSTVTTFSFSGLGARPSMLTSMVNSRQEKFIDNMRDSKLPSSFLEARRIRAPFRIL